MTNKNKNKKKVTSQKPKRKVQSQGIDYTKIANMVSKMALAKINPTLKTQAGSNSTLGNLGMLAGNGISKIFGLGAYKLKQNSMYDSHTGSQVPFMHSTDESIIFRHREYLGDIVSSTGYTTNVFTINPGLEISFPYLSAIASNFQEYKFRGLVFEYKSTSSTVISGANTAMGSVSMAAQYRADAPPIAGKLQLLNEMWSVDGRPSDSFILPIECSPVENPLSIQYVRTGSLPANQDVKLYDLAKVTIATQGQQTAGTIIGEIWVSYEIVLYKPIMYGGGQALGDNAFKVNRTGSTALLPLGTATASTTMDTLGLTIVGSTAISWPPGILGTYIVVVNWKSSAVVVAALSVTATNGSLTSVDFTPNNGTASDEFNYTAILTNTGDTIEDTTVLTFGTAGTIPAGNVTITIVQAPGGLL